ncbi:MAG: hypothetical protein K2X29_12775, partial [Candidatus Obscuribacterales bacterium]|nr:hypothetical protein [Candidatus Obscuribacterales bacterium]
MNDTGFFIANKKDRANTRTRLSAFEDVNKSETKLIFFLSKNISQDYWADWTSDEFVLEEK